MKNARALALATLTALTLLASGCSVMQGQESVGNYIDDRTITASVKTKLLEDPSVSGMAVDVDTLGGVVSLSGYAKTATEKTQAGALAQTAKGVKSVRNNLIVRP